MKTVRCACIVSITATLAGVMGGCVIPVDDWSNPNADAPPGLTRLRTAQELLDYYRQVAWAGFLSRSQIPCYCGPADVSAAVVISTANDVKAADAAEWMTSSEPDPHPSEAFVSDGTYLYIAKENSLRIVRATPVTSLAEVGRIDLEAEISRLYLHGSRVIALSSASTTYPPVYEIDVSDPAHPALVAQVKLPGNIKFSRLIADRLVLVVRTYTGLAPNTYTDPLGILQTQVEAILPTMDRGAGDQPLVPVGHWYRPNTPCGLNVIAVITLDANDITNVIDSVGVLASAEVMYCSDDTLYFTIGRCTTNTVARCQTDVHALHFGDDGVTEYVGSAAVAGQMPTDDVLNEFDGCLRIATVVPATDGAQQQLPHSNVSALVRRNGTLEVAGQVEGLAPQHSAQSVRSFRSVGPYTLLTASATTDPLYILDFSDPTAPQLLAQTTAPGLDGYLYALDDTHVIAVGENTISLSYDPLRGSLLSLYDVSDWSHPRVVQQLRLGGSGSYFISTPSAFTALAHQVLLILPTCLSDANTPNNFVPQFLGVIVFRVDANTGFTELGRLETADPNLENTVGWGQRGVILGNAAYSLAGGGVRGAPLNDLNRWTLVPLD